MSAQTRVKEQTQAAQWRLGALRHAASVWLLLGWSAFWLVATLQPCCKLSVAAPLAVSTETASQHATLDHHHDDADHQSPDSSGTCHDITIVAATVLTTAEHLFGGEDTAHAYPAGVIQAGYGVQWPGNALEYPPLPPPRTLRFYLRTSRVLI